LQAKFQKFTKSYITRNVTVTQKYLPNIYIGGKNNTVIELAILTGACYAIFLQEWYVPHATWKAEIALI